MINIDYNDLTKKISKDYEIIKDLIKEESFIIKNVDTIGNNNV